MSEQAPHPSVLLKRLEQRARKRFGQNFLVRDLAVNRIVRLAGVKADSKVLEIGPGLGALSRKLLATGAQVHAVELDRDLAGFLREELPDLTLFEGDAMKVDLDEVTPGTGWVACANLPYNVATRILLRLIDDERFDRLVLMFQREVAERIVANPGTKAYGSLSLMCQSRMACRVGLQLRPGDFHPAPKVHSSVVVLQRRPEPVLGGVSVRQFERAIRAGFAHRRKTLVNSLGQHYDKEIARQALRDSVGLGKRAQELSLVDWGKLAAALVAAEEAAQD